MGPQTGLDLRNIAGVDIGLRGWLLGSAIGGALGAAVRFDTPADIVKRYGRHGPTQFTGVFGKPGAITSDMQLTLLALDGMVRAHARKSWSERTDPVREVALSLRRWLAMEQDGWFPRANELFERRWADRTTVEAIRHFVETGTFGTIEQPINDSQENSVLGRAAVAAVWSSDLTEVFTLGARIGALTHGHPNAYLSAGAYAVMMQYLLRTNNISRAIMAAQYELKRWERHEEVHAALTEVAQAQYDPALGDDPATTESFGDSETAIGALAIALRAAMSEHRFEHVVGRAITITGDSAATGSLAGALYGVSGGGSHLPEDLIDQLELSDRITNLAFQVRREHSDDPVTHHAHFPYSTR